MWFLFSFQWIISWIKLASYSVKTIRTNLAGAHSHGVIRKKITVFMDSWVPCLSRSRCRCRVQQACSSFKKNSLSRIIVISSINCSLHWKEYIIRLCTNTDYYNYQQNINITTIKYQPIPHLHFYSLVPFSLAASPFNRRIYLYNTVGGCAVALTDQDPATFPDRDGRETLTITHQSLIP